VSDLRKAAKDLLHEYDSGIFDDDHDLIHAVNALRAALAAPRPEPVTDEEALRLWAGDAPRPVMGKNKVLAFTRAIERAHNIKGDKA
jgi:hypothetical protein